MANFFYITSLASLFICIFGAAIISLKQEKEDQQGTVMGGLVCGMAAAFLFLIIGAAFEPSKTDRERELDAAHTRAQYEAQRDRMIENANSEIKNGSPERAQIWIEKAQQKQEQIGN